MDVAPSRVQFIHHTFFLSLSLSIFYYIQDGRGLHPGIVLVDEADFLPVFLTVVLPLLSEIGVVLYALSSPKLTGGDFTNVVHAVDENGKKLTDSVILGEPCDACRTTPRPEHCTHKQDTLAGWKDAHREEHLKKIYHAVGRDDIVRAELNTMGTMASGSIFQRNLYVEFLSEKPKASQDPIDAVYIGIDPAYCGKCQFALVAVAHVSHKTKAPEFQVCLFVCLFVTHHTDDEMPSPLPRVIHIVNVANNPCLVIYQTIHHTCAVKLQYHRYTRHWQPMLLHVTESRDVYALLLYCVSLHPKCMLVLLLKQALVRANSECHVQEDVPQRNHKNYQCYLHLQAYSTQMCVNTRTSIQEYLRCAR